MGFSVGSWFNKIIGRTPPAAPPPPPTSTTPAGWNGSSAFGRDPLGRIGEILERSVENHFITPHDGFIAFDPITRAVTGGMAPTAVEHDAPKLGATFSSLARIFAGEEHGVSMRFRHGNVTVSGTATGREAELGASVNGALGQSIASAVHGKRGGLTAVTVSSSDDAKPAQARVLALPRDYDGPIFISDIDDTLRATDFVMVASGKVQPPIVGAKEILQGVAQMNVPIVYLSAGMTGIHAVNEAFLAQFPSGILLDDRDFKLGQNSALDQAAYKQGVIALLKKTYPKAKLFGLGDDKYGDAIAYTQGGVKAYIHDVISGSANVPPGFSGTQTTAYTPDFRQKLLGDLGAAVQQSTSLHG